VMATVLISRTGLRRQADGVWRDHGLPVRSAAAARSSSSRWQPGYVPNTPGNFHR
jgi:hypothetical protein